MNEGHHLKWSRLHLIRRGHAHGCDLVLSLSIFFDLISTLEA